ncbi:unnamed protein product [Rangifer tarandus platyrhynchus]|uniref:PX domain-containing protein n=1 Tax=Rangifer tarandus platyrhynchus TaxID=3082113 RepID=A0ABN8ZS81_RANTA|nr:unnamed protein product [Rangifer tarandus platyrhynchus]
MTESNFSLKKIEISVSEAEKRTGRNAMNMQETYTAYLIETRSVEHSDGQSVLTDSLWRRCSAFEWLRNYLLVYYPHIVVPPLPEKRAEFVWHKLSADNMDPDFVERLRIGLENFLLRLASHPILCRDKIFYLFLTQRVADRLYGVYKVHGNYGRVFRFGCACVLCLPRPERPRQPEAWAHSPRVRRALSLRGERLRQPEAWAYSRWVQRALSLRGGQLRQPEAWAHSPRVRRAFSLRGPSAHRQSGLRSL